MGALYIPVLTEVHLALPLLYGTIVYLYVKSALEQEFKLSSRHLFHLSTFLLFLGYITWRIHGEFELEVFTIKCIATLKPLVNIIYLTATLIYLNKRKTSTANIDKTKNNRKWISLLCFGGLGFCGLSLIGITANYIHPQLAPMNGDYLIGSFTSLYFFVLGFVALKNKDAFQVEYGRKLETSQAMGNKNSTGKKEFEALNEFMKTEKPYLDPQLSLYDLSKLFDVPVSRLSNLINNYGGLNFNDFVNTFRVEEVKENILSKKYEHLSILGIGLESGFNSKASFNRIFKKLTGTTPSAYKARCFEG